MPFDLLVLAASFVLSLVLVSWCLLLLRREHNDRCHAVGLLVNGSFFDAGPFRAIAHRGTVVIYQRATRLLCLTVSDTVRDDSPRHTTPWEVTEECGCEDHFRLTWTVHADGPQSPVGTTFVEENEEFTQLVKSVAHRVSNSPKRATIRAWVWLLYPRKCVALALAVFVLGCGMFAATAASHRESVTVKAVHVSESPAQCEFSLSSATADAVGLHLSQCPEDYQQAGDRLSAVALANSSYAVLLDKWGLSLVSWAAFIISAALFAVSLVLAGWRLLCARSVGTIGDEPHPQELAEPWHECSWDHQDDAPPSMDGVTVPELSELSLDQLAHRVDAAEGSPRVRRGTAWLKALRVARMVPWSSVCLILLWRHFRDDWIPWGHVLIGLAGIELAIFVAAVAASIREFVAMRQARDTPVEVIRVSFKRGMSTALIRPLDIRAQPPRMTNTPDESTAPVWYRVRVHGVIPPVSTMNSRWGRTRFRFGPLTMTTVKLSDAQGPWQVHDVARALLPGEESDIRSELEFRAATQSFTESTQESH